MLLLTFKFNYYSRKCARKSVPDMFKKWILNSTKFLGLVASILVLFSACVFVMQDKLFFHPRPSNPNMVAKYKPYEVYLEHQNVGLQGWYIPASGNDKPTLFYYGGNAEEISQMIPSLLKLGDYNFVLFNYRGYGSSTGKPGETAFKQDALFIFDWVIKTYGIIPETSFIIGRSLGTGVAVHTTALRDTAAVILITPFDSIERVAHMALPPIPFKPPVKYPFRSIDYLPDIKEPGLILVAEKDRVIPRESTDALISAWVSPLQTVILKGTQHNLIFTDEFYTTARRFILDNHRVIKPSKDLSQNPAD